VSLEQPVHRGDRPQRDGTCAGRRITSMRGLTILIPTLNEAGTVGDVLRSIPDDYSGAVLIVDGGSTDATVPIARGLGFPVIQQRGRGLGDAIMTGVHSSDARVFVTLDADGAHTGEHVVQLLEVLERGYDLVVASRMSDAPEDAGTFSRRRQSTEPAGFVRNIGNRLFTSLCRGIFGLPLHDVLNGCKAFRREVFLEADLNQTGQAHDLELALKAHRAGFRIADVAIHQGPRLAGASKLHAFHDGRTILGVILSEVAVRQWRGRRVMRPFRGATPID
jgi:glycosyltransferase involved in cell wall biosynthesis